MLVRLVQATTITVALYILLGLNGLQPVASQSGETKTAIDPPEVLVAIKQVFTKRQ